MYIKLYAFNLFFLTFGALAELGEDCKLPNGSSGDCVLVSNCPSALASIYARQKPTICGFQGVDSLVCCEKSKPLTKSQLYCEILQVPKGRSEVGSVDALPQEFQHMASLGYGQDLDNVTWNCGGSLISRNFILTAAHCLTSKIFGDVKFVRLGDLNLKLYNESAEPQDFKVARTFRHPDHKAPSKYHDIALIQLDGNVTESDFVKPACLFTKRRLETSTFIATGWGQLGFTGNLANHLQKVTVKEAAIERCRGFYDENPRTLSKGIVGDWQICAGDMFKDTCQGDSGGPLQVKLSNYTKTWTIYGVTSFGKPCGLSEAPGIYTRVSNYIEWIESVIWPDNVELYKLYLQFT